MTQNQNKKPSVFLRFTGVAFQMGIIIALGTFLGKYLDGKDPDFPLYTLILSLVSVLGSLYLVIREVIRLGKENDSES